MSPTLTLEINERKSFCLCVKSKISLFSPIIILKFVGLSYTNEHVSSFFKLTYYEIYI